MKDAAPRDNAAAPHGASSDAATRSGAQGLGLPQPGDPGLPQWLDGSPRMVAQRRALSGAATPPPPKLQVGASNDAQEHAADRLASRAVPGHGLASDGAAVSPASPAPDSVRRVLGSPGRPLDGPTRSFFESRFGHDLAGVRVHDDPQAAASARAIGARAYAAGGHIALAPGPASERPRLMAHELAHVLQREAPTVVRRAPVSDAASNPVGYSFSAGTELDLAFMQLAQRLVRGGPLGDAGVRALRTQALARRGTVNDPERMFMAGLQDAANATALRALPLAAGASITFPLASMPAARVQQVIDLDREALPASVAAPLRRGRDALFALRPGDALRETAAAEVAAEAEIAARAAAFTPQATALVAFARARAVPLNLVLRAMLAAASDSTPGDQVLAGITYAIAAAAGLPNADEVLAGRIKVDALIPAAFARLPVPANVIAFYATTAQGSGLKGDTIYLQTSVDIGDLYQRSLVIHELRHAEEDQGVAAGAALQFPAKNRMELRGYRAQAGYLLREVIAAPAADRPRAARSAAGGGSLVLGAMLLEAMADPARWRPALEPIFAAAPGRLAQTPAQVGRLLALPAARIEAVVLADIDAGYGLAPGATGVIDGLSGESTVSWIFRV